MHVVSCSELAKKYDPNVITVFGGPNFPTEKQEKLEFLQKPGEIGSLR